MKDQIKAILMNFYPTGYTELTHNRVTNKIDALYSPAKLPDIIYFHSFSEAISHAFNKTNERGYEMGHFAFGTRKPEIGRYERLTIELTKDSKPVKQCLHIQVYRMSEETFELNYYIQ